MFTISIRKDIDKGTFTFPEKEPLKLRLKDMLEEQVDEKYYLSDKMIAGFTKHNENHIEKGTMGNILESKKNNSNVIGHLEMDKWQDHMKRIYDANSYAPTLGTMQGGNTEPKILEDFYKNRPAREYEEVAPTLRSERIGLKVVEPQDSIRVSQTLQCNDSMGVVTSE